MNHCHIISRIVIVLFLVMALAAPATASPPPSPPVADFTVAGATSGTPPLTVQFTDTSLHTPTGWTWSFGDNGTATVKNPSHTYTAVGNFTVTLHVTNGDGADQIQKAGYITVTPTLQDPPQVRSVAPAAGYRNMTVAFVITGSGFVPGYTTIEFRNQSSGIMVPSIASVTPSAITGFLTIPAYAVPGSWNVRVGVQGRGENIALNAFSITSSSSPPKITGITPSGSWYRNSTVNYSIAGSNFEWGYTTVTFMNKSGTLLNGSSGAGVTLVTATMINGTIHVPADAPTVTPYNITVTTFDGGTAAKEGAITVAAQPLPAITAIAPAGTWYQHTNVSYSLTGTGFEPGRTVVTFQNKSGMVLDANVTSITATRINGTAMIPVAQPVGPYNITITTIDGGMTKKDAAFAVAPQPAPVVTALTPAGTWTYGSMINFSITGSNFNPDNTFVLFWNRSGLPVGGAITSITASRINGTVIVGPGMPVGPFNVTVTTPDGGTTAKEGVFSIAPQPAPVIASFTPATGVRNTVIPFTLTGSNFEDGGRTQVLLTDEFFGAFIPGTLSSVTPTKITGTFEFPSGFPTGTFDCQVITLDGGTTTKPAMFVLDSLPTPTITGITPASGIQGNLVNFTVTGTNFEQGDGNTMVFFYNPVIDIAMPADIINVTGPAIRGSIVLPPGLWTGPYDVQVWTADGGTATKAGAFTITTQRNPTVTSIAPVTAPKNSTAAFVIRGTNFPTLAPPLVRLYRAADGYAIYATVSDSNITTITGTFDIPFNATAGRYRLDIASPVTVSSGSKENAFTVTNVSAPQVTAVTPTSAYRNRTFVITVTGSNFQGSSGTTANLSTPSYAREISLALINLTPTRFNGTVTFPADVPAGASWKLNITTIDGGTTTKTSAIAITSYPEPTIGTITPVTGFRNTTVLFTLTGTNFQTAGGNDTYVWFWNRTSHAMIAPTIYSVTPTLVTGSIALPDDADPAYNVNITTVDGGTVMKQNAFAATKIPPPSIASLTPPAMYRGATTSFSLRGSNFQNSGRTAVNLTNASGYSVATTLWNIYPSTITGTVTIPAGTANGSWSVNVTTLNGGTTGKSGAVSVL
jgi:PKD repeat protein